MLIRAIDREGNLPRFKDIGTVSYRSRLSHWQFPGDVTSFLCSRRCLWWVYCFGRFQICPHDFSITPISAGEIAWKAENYDKSFKTNERLWSDFRLSLSSRRDRWDILLWHGRVWDSTLYKTIFISRFFTNKITNPQIRVLNHTTNNTDLYPELLYYGD